MNPATNNEESSHYITIHTADKKSESCNKGDQVFSMYCFTPEFVFKQIHADNPVGLIITSGTLSPLDSFSYELGVKFRH